MRSIKGVFKYLKIGDFLHVLLAALVFPFAIVAKIFIRDFWLVTETKSEARDNGYWFFKWVRENRPKQRIAYAIDKKSPDYGKVKPLGKVVSRGTAAHWFWYIVADKNISSQKHGKPNAAVCYFFEVVLGLRKNNRVFLQHGVTKDDMDWLYYKNTKMRLFVTAAGPEHEFVCERYGYPDGYVKLLGFARHDALLDAEADDDLILAMPTWREWLGRESSDNRGADFSETEYCIKWNEFLNSEKLDALLKESGKRMMFYPHRNMQKFLPYFSAHSDRITIADWREYDIQDVLKRAAVMVTDYSSVFFDFAYMSKPVVFYQFDEAEYREKQYALGYFDYHATPLGRWCGTLDDVVDGLAEIISGGNATAAVDGFFPFRDGDCCLRTFEAIKSIKGTKDVTAHGK